MASYPEAVDFLYQLQWHGIKLGLENIRKILQDLSNPHERYAAVHIGGTNGKGSTAALTASVLQAQGYRVGLYTSPHLVDFSERIRINGVPISHDAVAELTERISHLTSHVSHLTPTFFEFTTAMAFLYFAESSVDLAVIEVGLGGRFDATNVITPAVSVITNVDYDHQAYLGNTLAQIAFEKAGIIKPGIPAVTAVENAEAMEVIEKTGRERGSRLYRLGRDFHVDGVSPGDFGYRGIGHQWPHLAMRLLGRHQLKNAACALAALELLSDKGFDLSEAAVRSGLHSAVWEGRLEPIEMPGKPLILLDGAHNPAGAGTLREYLAELKAERGGRVFLVLGIMQDKDIPAVMAELVPLSDFVVLTRPDYHRAASLEDLEKAVVPFGVPTGRRPQVGEAVEFAGRMAGPKDLICVTGSLFTVGEARAILKHLGSPSKVRG
jgi:dihydrofolate synthase/folylpolyglutamate synthase